VILVDISVRTWPGFLLPLTPDEFVGLRSSRPRESRMGSILLASGGRFAVPRSVNIMFLVRFDTCLENSITNTGHRGFNQMLLKIKAENDGVLSP